MMGENGKALEHLDQGNASAYVEARLFGNSFDDLSSHIKRKKALADEGRYTILYLLYEYGELSRKRLSDETGRVSNKLEQPLRRLLKADLIEKIPGPERADKRKTYYRVTPLGRQAIASDIENIIGGTVGDSYYRALEDPALDPEAETETRIRHDGWDVVGLTTEGLRDQQTKLREQHEQVSTAQGSDTEQ